MNQIDLKDRHAIVTGGAKGIGQAIAARALASGARVTIWDIDVGRTDQTIKELGAGDGVRGDMVDVTDPDAIARGLDEAIAGFGNVDILVNNAGSVGTVANLWEQPVENWQRMLTLNLTSAFLCCRAVTPHMIENGYGRIVNIASNAGKMATLQNSPYAAAKAGLIGLTRYFAARWGPAGIRVNAIAPGGVESGQNDVFAKRYGARVPLGRMARSDEVVGAVVWLASDAASYVTGQVISIDGGLTAW